MLSYSLTIEKQHNFKYKEDITDKNQLKLFNKNQKVR